MRKYSFEKASRNRIKVHIGDSGEENLSGRKSNLVPTKLMLRNLMECKKVKIETMREKIIAME